MPTDHCLCGALNITISGEPVVVALCHCRDCQRISGSASGFNWVVPAAQLSVTDTLKEYTSTANSGNPVTSHFRGNCCKHSGGTETPPKA